MRVTYGGVSVLELKKQGATFTVTDAQVVKGGDPDTSYTLRVLTRDDEQRLIEKIARACEKSEWNHELRRMDTVLDQRRAKVELTLAVLDHILVEWSGVTDADTGTALPCTLEFKRMLPQDRQDSLLDIARANAQVKAAARDKTFPGT